MNTEDKNTPQSEVEKLYIPQEINDRKISKKYLIVSSLTLLVSLVMLIFATVAWFTGEVTGITSQTVVLDTDGIDLDVSLYKGNDLDRDGILDNVVENGTVVDTSTLSPEQIIGKQYTEVIYDEELLTSGCMPGVKLIYKLVVKNPNKFGAKINVNFSKLDDYFKQAYENVGVTNGEVTSYHGHTDLTELNTLVGENSARIMFEVNSISAYDYTSTQFSSVGSSGTQRTLSSTSSNLWAISDMQNFVEGVEVGPSDTLEINFIIECKQLQDIVTDYNDYITNVYSTDKTADEKNKINAFAQFELNYVTNINITENTTRNMYFTIKYLSVRGEQLGR